MTRDRAAHSPRLTAPDRDSLGPESQRIYDELADPDGRFLRGLGGPGGLRLHSPRLAEAVQPLGDFLRFESSITPWMREVAILTTAREIDSDFEWAAHEPEARRVGVEPEIIEVIKRRRGTEGLPEPAAAIIDLGREAIAVHKVSAVTYSRALRSFGPTRLVELTSLMGQYMATGLLIAVFDYRPDSDDAQLPHRRRPRALHRSRTDASDQ